MFAVGHMSVAYLLTRGLKRGRWQSISIPLVWASSLLPDLDLLIPGINHMGPTHSIIVATAIFTPIMIYYKKGISYYASLLSHSLIGDYITAYGCQLLWPINQTGYKYEKAPQYCPATRTQTISLEIFLFAIMIGHILIEKYKNTRTNG